MSRKSSLKPIATAGLAAGVALAGIATGKPAQAAGFEKVIMESGKYSGIAGVTTSNVEGAESLYFNPAGLVSLKGTARNSFSLNLSPTLSKFNGPILYPVQQGSNTSFSLPFSALASYGINENLSVGIGAYVSGGTKAKYENIDLTPVGLTTLKGTSESSLSVTEFSAGAAYRLLPGLKLGLSYRVLLVKADLSTTAPLGGVPGAAGFTAANLNVNGLSNTRWNGFKIGAQYAPESQHFGLGASWRTPVTFLAHGTSSGTLGVVGLPAAASITGGDATVQATLPSQIALGGYYDINPKVLRVGVDYVWTEYSTDKSLDLTGNVGLPTGGSASLTPLSIPLGWKNLNNLKFGIEYSGIQDYFLRAGYAFTSQVTPNDRARATFSSPGSGHTFTLGLGHPVLNNALDLDAALEYSMASGTVVAADTPQAATPTGDYNSKAYALHTGVTYRF